MILPIKQCSYEKSKITLFLSIHSNATSDNFADREVSGSEVYYFYPQSKPLAKSILQGITETTGLKDNGVKGGSFAVIRNTNAVSVLIEVAYMITPEDNVKLRNPEFQDEVANGIFKGLENYINDIRE